MKKLIFIRHGKAEDLAPEISDFERSLTLKGKIISKMVAHRMKEKVSSPGLIITSPAFRALETAIIFAEEYEIEPEKIVIDSNLYYRMNSGYLSELLSQTSDDISSITFFGHNPSFTEIPNRLCIEGCGFMPKNGVIGITFNIKTWGEVSYNTGRLEYFLKPEKLL